MVTPALMLALVLGGSADDLMTARYGALTLQVPAVWKHSVQEGSHKYLAPSGEAFFLLDVGRVATPPMDPGACRKKILDNMGGDTGWQMLSIGAAPAARKLDLDVTPDKKDQVQTYTFVGCDGTTTWSLVFHLDSKKKDRFAPLAERVAKSVLYVHPERK